MLQCAEQDVQWFESEEQCQIALSQYTEIPADGDFKVVQWQCKPVNSKGV